MLERKDYFILILGFLGSIAAGILTQFSIHFIYLSIIILLVTCICILIKNTRLLYLKLQLVRYVGIKKIETNISTETNTEKLLSLVKNNFYMMGRGGSRFIEAQNLESTLTRVDRRSPVKFLLLKPDTSAPTELARERGVEDNHISNIISATIKTLEKLKERRFNIEYRFYNNPSYTPIFRVVIIDDREAYISYYPRRETGKNSFQLVLYNNPQNTNNLFTAFKAYFETMWEIAKSPDHGEFNGS